jgi:hypothetical protein
MESNSWREMQNSSVLVASMAVLKPPQKTMPMTTPIIRTQKVALRVREVVGLVVSDMACPVRSS